MEVDADRRYIIDVDRNDPGPDHPDWRGERDRKRMTIKGLWDDSLLKVIAAEKITALQFNLSLGWRGNDFTFLRSLVGAGIEQLQILNGTSAGLETIGELVELRYLSLQVHTGSTIEFSRLDRLEYVATNWWPGVNNIFDKEGLTSLSLFDLRLRKIDRLASLPTLKRIDIRNASIQDIDFLRTGSRVEVLWLRDCRGIGVFEPLFEMRSLLRLILEGCRKLHDLGFVRHLPELEHFDFSACGPIPTLKPVCAVKTLKALSFYGSTDILDGDLSCLMTLPKLAMLGFKPRKHYTHRPTKAWNWNDFDQPDTVLKPVSSH